MWRCLSGAAAIVGLAACAAPVRPTGLAAVPTTRPPAVTATVTASTTTVRPSTTEAVPTTTEPPTPPEGGVIAARLVSARLGLVATASAGSLTARLWVTTDMTHWSDVTPPGLVGVLDDVSAVDRQHLWVTVSACALGSTNETLWRTVDGGLTWLSSGVEGHMCAAGSTSLLSFRDPLHGAIASLEPTGPVGHVLTTADGGRTWQGWPFPVLGPVVFPTPADGFVAATSAPEGSPAPLEATHDGGRSWAAVGVAVPADYVSWHVLYGLPTFYDPSHGILPVTLIKANTALVVWYATADSGHTWSMRADPHPVGVAEGAPQIDHVALTAVAGRDTWWTLGWNTGGWDTQVTTDGGRHWTTVRSAPPWTTPQRLDAVGPAEAWVITQYATVYRTDNAGATFTLLQPPSVAGVGR